MSRTIKLKKGFNINLAGRAVNEIKTIEHPETFALKPTDFNHLTMVKLLVGEGDNVKAGDPVYYEKTMQDVLFCAPVSGEIIEIKRGARRRVLEIKILADRKVEFKQLKAHSPSELISISRDYLQNILSKGGVWPNIIQRPYGEVANPSDTPKAIFISGFDSHPLAPDYAFSLNKQEQYFQEGIHALKKFTSGSIYLSTHADTDIAGIFARVDHVKQYKFYGKHPVGNVGVQIHHINPINKGDIVWTVSPNGVIEIGKFLLTGTYDTSRLIAVTGSQIQKPCYVKTYTGACLNKLVANNVKAGDNRYITGNILTGEGVGINGYLGYYHQQITVIPEGKHEEFLGWIKPSVSKFSFHKAFGLLSYINRKNKEFVLDTNQHGEHRNFVVSGAFEKVLPMDILPTYLFKAIMAEDYNDMEALGIYELIEEDVALCEFIDVSKHNLQQILREGIELIKNG